MSFAVVKNSSGQRFTISNKVKNSDGTEFLLADNVKNSDGTEFPIFAESVLIVPRKIFIAESNRVFIA